MKRKWLSKADVFFILAVLLVVLLFFMPQRLSRNGETVAEVTVDGAVKQTIHLEESGEKQQYRLENGMVLETENGSIRVLYSDCSDALCMHTGALSRAGEIAACVPNKTVIVLRSEKDTAVDGITY